MIESNIPRPAVNQRTRVEIFDAANSQRLSILHLLSAGKLGFRTRPGRRFVFAVEMPIETVSLDRNPPSFANRVLEGGDGLLLRRSRAGHVKDFFFHDRAVQIVDAVTKRNLRKRQTETDPIRGQMIDVIQINSADCEIAKLIDGRSTFDVSEHGGLWFKRERDEAAKAARFILKLPKLSQMVDALLESFDVAVEHRARAAATQSVPNSMNVEPFFGGFFAATNPIPHFSIKDLRATAGD